MESSKILVVEDEPIIAEDITESLGQCGYQIVGKASTGEDAIALAREHRPDLVLMDIQLRGDMDGIAAAAIIRESCGIPVVYLTAFADEDTFDRAKITEPYGYVLKPFKELELRTAIELALYRFGGQAAKSRTAAERELNDSSSDQLEPRTKEIYDILRKVEPFHVLDERGLKIAAKGARLQKFEAGSPVVFEGDSADEGFVVVSGRIALIKSSASGKELIVEMLPPGDPFGLLVALDKPDYSVSVQAQVASEVLWIPRGRVKLILDGYPEVSRKLVAEVFERLRKSHDHSRALAHDLVEVRVASTLAALVPRFCVEDSSGEKASYTLEMTRQELAEMIGSTSETVIRVTKAMEREGLLDLTRSGVIKILDLDGVVELAEQ